eukprot:GCRY01002035.1.p1 GENE.GCRY01002035.1~~GCRY01002035.1.p1  ORF type:complete len:364 (+),score=45.31 GCRY01002035.1:254-1345(+)
MSRPDPNCPQMPPLGNTDQSPTALPSNMLSFYGNPFYAFPVPVNHPLDSSEVAGPASAMVAGEGFSHYPIPSMFSNYGVPISANSFMGFPPPFFPPNPMPPFVSSSFPQPNAFRPQSAAKNEGTAKTDKENILPFSTAHESSSFHPTAPSQPPLEGDSGKKRLRDSEANSDPTADVASGAVSLSTDSSKRRRKSSNDPKDKPFVCPQPGCGKTFRAKWSLTIHYRSVHLKEKPYKCGLESCNRRFSDRSNCIAHFKTHVAAGVCTEGQNPIVVLSDTAQSNSTINTLMRQRIMALPKSELPTASASSSSPQDPPPNPPAVNETTPKSTFVLPQPPTVADKADASPCSPEPTGITVAVLEQNPL